MLAWHYVKNDYCTNNGNVKVYPGLVLTHDGPMLMCRSGLHASIRALDALKYARGSIVCRVRCSRDIVMGTDKIMCRRRVVSWTLDAANTLHEFACHLAQKALRSSGVTSDRAWNAIRVKRDWLAGEATDRQLAATAASLVGDLTSALSTTARNARWSTKKEAAFSASWAAACAAGYYGALPLATISAARNAARSAAWTAAGDGMKDAAWHDALDAAKIAAWETSNRKLEQMLYAHEWEQAD